MAKLPDHLFVASSDGALYDTRAPNWSRAPALRGNYRSTHSEIRSVADMKATLRNGQYAWPGGYQMYFICSDGAALCFDCARKESRNIFEAIANKDGSGWRVVATDINYEDSELRCEHCSKSIPAAYKD
jgi:hypothetical protein